MSVKNIILSTSALIIVGAFVVAGVVSASKVEELRNIQSTELNSKDAKIEDLNIQYDQVNDELEKAVKENSKSKSEIERLKKEQAKAEKERKELEAKLQARVNLKYKLASASVAKYNKTPGHDSIESIVINAAKTHGISSERALRIARCESGLNPSSVNYGYWEDSQGISMGGTGEKYYPSGIFQHLSKYWPSRSEKYGYKGASVFDPVANANVTMAMWRDGYSSQWECS